MLEFLKGLSVTDVLTILISASSIVFGAISFIKARKKAHNANEEFVFQENLLQTIINAMETAEKTLTPLKTILGSSVAEMKLEDVVRRVENYCLSNGKQFDKDKVQKIVNDLINFSKIVNYKKSV